MILPNFAVCQEIIENENRFVVSTIRGTSNPESFALFNVLNARMVKDFDYTKDAFFLVEPFAESVEQNMIEGMEVQYLTKLKISLRVRNLLNNDEWSWVNTFTGKGTMKSESLERSVTNFINKDSGYKNFKKELEDYISKLFIENCSSIISLASKESDLMRYEKCISILKQVPAKSPCFKDAESMTEKAFEQLQLTNCEKIMHVAILKKSEKDYHSAINQLIRISPHSPCAENALKLAVQIEADIDEKLKNSNSDFKFLKIIIDSQTDSQFKAQWLKKAIELY